MSYSMGNMVNDVEYFKATSASQTAIAFESFENWLSTIENIPEAEGEIYQASAQLLQSNFVNMADIAATIPQLPENSNDPACS